MLHCPSASPALGAPCPALLSVPHSLQGDSCWGPGLTACRGAVRAACTVSRGTPCPRWHSLLDPRSPHWALAPCVGLSCFLPVRSLDSRGPAHPLHTKKPPPCQGVEQSGLPRTGVVRDPADCSPWEGFHDGDTRRPALKSRTQGFCWKAHPTLAASASRLLNSPPYIQPRFL